jgi:hypothetical protein
MKKASKLEEIDAAVNKFQPVTPDHEFYVNFDNVRGDFQERDVMRRLNVDSANGHCFFNYSPNQFNKTLLFLAGMRGSGKTSELAKYAQKLNSPDCFFVITCNIDEELDMDNIQYMDIVIFQLEKLLKRAQEVDLSINDDILDSMQRWFKKRVIEINKNLKAESSAEIEFSTDKPFSVGSLLGQLLGITTTIKAGLSGSAQRAETIRQDFQNRFGDFSAKFNTFIEQVNEQLREEKKGKEVLFIIDGLEKTMSADTRRKIIMEESNRIRQIKANTLFTLPIELMKEEQRIQQFAEIISFPFIKIKERNGSPCANSIALFEQFIFKRIDPTLFDNKETVAMAIAYSGGSPRQLLRILEQAAWATSIEEGIISKGNMERAIEKLGNSVARFLSTADFELLKTLKNSLDDGQPIGYDEKIQGMLEKEIIFEYNDGTYKRVNPLVEISKLYKHHVASA